MPQNAYKHQFKRIIGAENAKGINFKVLGKTGKLVKYDETTHEDAERKKADFSRVVEVKSANGIEWALPGKDKGKFKYYELVEFKK